MGRNIIAFLAGLIGASLVVSLFELLAVLVHPLPENFDRNNINAMIEHAKTAPLSAILIVLVAYTVGAYTGGLITTLISKTRPRTLSILIAVIYIAFTIFNLLKIPHPFWFGALAILVWIPFALLGYKTGMRMKRAKL
ncbi:hypothetical protein DBR32_01890 [Taibaiella sp. KBW10]|uniref:hypothetical protein n=1 Tax=Taibaiella sp. KBW10 TaxID=2153357 RepID=UPI000F59E372|nr:hypothetical protein [Taibaiella sp. KBW10]RQO32379.1 hypothetical protein DBR32_01890 [Taibaiella sp. KBW10]